MSSDKVDQILKLVEEYIEEKRSSENWVRGEDWVNYSGPYYGSEEYTSAIKILLSEWLIFGKQGRHFENVFPPHLGQKYGVLTNSGSSANLLMANVFKSKSMAMRKYHMPPGSKFITPVVCFPTTINPLIQAGYEPVFVDVDLPSMNLNLDEVEEELRKDPSIRAITFAHVLGNPPNMDRLMGLVKEYNLNFLEDSCDALGSFYDGKKLGSFGLISTCSFFPAHHMTTGEGGFAATSNPRVRKVLASIRDWGRACYCNERKPGDVTAGTACGDRFQAWLSDGKNKICYDHRYVFDEIGFNTKPLDLQAAMGLHQLDKLPEMDAARRKNFKRMEKSFSKYEDFFMLPKATEKADPCWFGYALTVKENDVFDKQELVSHFEENKVQTRSYFTGNCLYHPAYREFAEKYGNDYGDLVTRFPNADIVTKQTFFLGTYIGLTPEKLDYIEDVLDEFFKDRGIEI
mgnify:FL=1